LTNTTLLLQDYMTQLTISSSRHTNLSVGQIKSILFR